jgi:hypothetical protein
MAKDQADFTKGRMNKSVDERLLPKGEYIDAQNVRLGSTELSEVGAVENAKGNVQLTILKYDGVALSGDAVCIGALDNSAKETMYWFVHDPNHQYGGVVDMIVSFNTQTQQLTYHVVTTVLLNFNPTYLVNGVNLIDDLLFFTDNYNPPRKINVTRAYPQPIAHVDQITELDISVIKPQPKESPVLTLQANQANDNFMEDAFLCFAYRYKYRDGEYSATSQFSDPAFFPSEFSIQQNSYMNAGMENAINSVVVEFDTGNANVIGIDIVFKEMDSNVIWVAKKLNKVAQGYQNNSTQSITFSNGDIYTILNQSEILRAYDGVPRLAKAQTIMGNRLMYGNYLEGYDLKDDSGNDIQLTYTVEQQSEVESAFVKEEDRGCVGCLFNVEYLFSGNNQNVLNSPYNPNEILVDLSGIPISDLIDGAEILVAIETRANAVRFNNPQSTTVVQERYYPYIGDPLNEVTESLRTNSTIQFIYKIQGNNHSTYESAFSGQSWWDQIGTSGNYQQSPSNYGNGYTLTDNYNASWSIPPVSADPNVYLPLTLIRSAIDNDNLTVRSGTDPFEMFVSGTHLHVVPNGFEYEYYAGGTVIMIPQLVSVRVTFKKRGTQQSLHSNRDYQVGIVYQDAEGRQTTALESKLNSFHVSAYDSENINWATVTIPDSMRPPYWADRYKFVMKQTETDYETIYSTTYFREVLGIDADDARTGRAWVRLEGENADKVKEGQELYVKIDFSGAVNEVIKTTVLEVKSMAQGDIYQTIDGGNIIAPTPAGVYMLVVPDNFSVSFANETSVLTNGKLTEKTRNGKRYPDTLMYPLHDGNGPWQIPTGSTVKIKTHLHRREYDRIEQDACGRETCNFEYEGVANQDYGNLRDFFLGEGVNIPVNSDCGPWGFDDDSDANINVFYPDIYNYDSPNTTHGTAPTVDPQDNTDNSRRYSGPNNPPDENHFQFTEKPSTNQFWFEIQSGTHHCWGGGSLARPSKIECEISIYPANAALVFETIPTTTTGEIYYENSESFQIVNGAHLSGNKVGDVDQVIGVTDGEVNLGFFNCYSFFNGVESYKVRDSVSGKKIYLGNRVTAVSDQDYKEIRRESSITYSGIYNNQNNINRLNEFNIGQANYKDCESSYGPIQLLHGRRSDLLALQEDRISYIAIGKNMLVTATGEGILTSVPEILGIQVARSEEYGISENPESFAHYGSDIYFTDAKRASVIQLKGDSASESLSVVSNNGMRSWFRDLFQTSFGYQKLGGYDPYMDEYILSPNTNRLPFEIPVYGCGGGDMQFTGLLEAQTFIIDFGNTYGNVTVSGNASVSTTVDVTYNGTTTSSGAVTGNFAVVFDKDVPSVTQATITITPNAPATDSITIINSIGCPIADFIRIIPIVITSADDNGLTRSQIFYFNDNTVGYTSPLWEDFNLTFLLQNVGYSSSNIVSKFGPQINGYQGTGMIPMDGADVYMQSKRINDTFYYNPSANSMRYWRTNVTYSNNAADIATILANSTALTNMGTDPSFFGTFPMPASTPPPAPADSFLYLVWDYREVNEIVLCFSPTVSETCCECFSSPTCVPFLGTTIETSYAAACALTPLTTYYTSTITIGGITNTEPILGTIVYSYLGCVSGNTVGTGYIKLTDNTWVRTNENGEVVITGTC